MSTISPYDESTARTLLNMHLVALSRQEKIPDLTDPTEALQFITDLSAHDQRIASHLEASHIPIGRLVDYLKESLEALSLAPDRELVPMFAPVPPNLEKTIGYSGQLLAMFT